MCGIAGIFGKLANKNNILKMLYEIEHRGPDNKGYSLNDYITIGATRLSIIDLSNDGNMPMKDKSDYFEIVFNGEIYNFKEIKEKFNIKTKSKTDTEIILELYKIKKEKCLEYLNGIFAFTILDKQKQTLFCARDRLGIKPFYFYNDNNNFIFSSEIKPIIAAKENYNYDEDYILNYFNSGQYNFNKNTFFKDIYQLDPGHFLIKSKSEFKIEKYWKLKKRELNLSKNEIKSSFFEILKNSYKQQLNTDTNLGINVSSGIDSVAMICILNEINGGQKSISANSYFFDEKEIDEKNQLEKFSKDVGWHINFQLVKPNDIINNADTVVKSQEQPFPGVITFAKYMLIKNNYDKFRKVILEAQGGDEITGGYRHVFPFYIKDLIKSLKFFKSLNEIKCFIKNEGINIKEFFKFYKNSIKYLEGKVSADGTEQINVELLKTIPKFNFENKFEEDLVHLSNVDKVMFSDLISTKLQRILKACDKTSMSLSKELRVPMLNHELVEFCFSVPSEFKINKGSLRNFYRETIHEKFFLNNRSSINFSQKKKNYVSDPQTKWLKNDLFDWAYSILSDKNTFISNFFDRDKVVNKFIDFKTNKSLNNSFFFWQLINIELWHKNFFKKKN